MMYSQINFPLLMKWQARLARVPRWMWIAFFIGALLPIAVVLAMALVAGLLVLASVIVLGTFGGMMYRLLHRHRHRSTGARGEIVVTAVRVVDP